MVYIASGSLSHTTDSEHNSSAPLEDVKVEAENSQPAPEIFKSPLPGKKKKYKRKRPKSEDVSVSDDDDPKIVGECNTFVIM